MQTETTNFLDELLAEAEVKEEKQTAAYYDLLILEVSKLEAEIVNNFEEAKKEVEIINEWTLNKNAAIQERTNFIRLKLENYIRGEGKKTISLPHGELKIRKQPDKVEIADMQLFLAKANDQMLTVVPETVKPDLTKIKAFIKRTTKIPEGVTLIEGAEQFKLTLRNSQITEAE
jgi:hypothetical protein